MVRMDLSLIFMYMKLNKVSTLFLFSGNVKILIFLVEYNDETMKGIWSSTNFCEIRGDPLKSATYKLMTSILYELNIKLG